jgi:two-component system chemotaxis sensor kinase CheA
MDPLKDQVTSLSLLVVMTPENDAAGVELLVSVCQDVHQAAVAAGDKRIVAALEEIFKNKQSPTIYKLINEFASTAGQYLEGAGDAKFANEKDGSASGLSHPDLAESLDTSFLVEFIETHKPKLDELEVMLVDEDLQAERDTGVKRYLHNLKGDSGSIGLVGVERACHKLEDSLQETSTNEMVGDLLQFKEWVVECLDALAAGKLPLRSETDFFAGLAADVDTIVAVPVVQLSQPSPAKAEDKFERYSLSGESDILLEFAAEAEEHLVNVERVTLEAEGHFNKDAVDTIFRCIHSLKGGSAYFQLEEMTKSSHILENFLSEVRDGQRTIDPELNSLILTYIDLQKDILGRAKSASAGDGSLKWSTGSIEFMKALERYSKGQAQVASAGEDAKTEHLDERSEGASKSSKLDIKDFVKVETNRLDHLIDSIGEMVIYSSMLIRYCRTLLQDNEDVMDMTHRVEKFSRDLQDVGMSMRLVPIKGLFQKMSRLVWDTSKKIGKSIHFTMDGEDTELDRNLIDKLADPLMHMVRNALDHGVEPPQERELAGKPKQGQVKLSAFHSGGSIHIQITDDGRGLNPEKLLAKAIDKGIVSPGQKLSEEEIFQLIFAPGFSTAAVVTDISGRGVGMDVVRRNVESLRGQIHIKSEVGKGSTFTIELPLTLAIIDGIQIRVGKELFVIPSLSIVEFVRPTLSMITNTLDVGETMFFRDRYLPVYRLSDLYGIEDAQSNLEQSEIVVVENGHEMVAIMVDEILGQCSTVIKSLGPLFEENRGTAGCAVMPTGDVALIIDIRSLVQLARQSYRLAWSSENRIGMQ